MSLSSTQRLRLDQLSIENGGILGEEFKVESVDNPVVIIGLGGLGCKTINIIKKKMLSRMKKYNNVRLLAIDSSEPELKDIKKGSRGGYLDDSEVLSLYDTTIANMCVNPAVIPGYIKEWLAPGYVPKIDGNGCGQIRQNGRFILSAPVVYKKVVDRITARIVSAATLPDGTLNSEKPHVLIVAGVGGGTGSGTVIDVSYIVHSIMLSNLGKNAGQYRVAGYIYTPDAQFMIDGINRKSLGRNGYAALKEINYYMNIHNIHGVYKWPFVDNKPDLNVPIFDSCTLVMGQNEDGVVITGTVEKAIDVMSDTIMLAVSNSQFTDPSGLNVQMLEALMDNKNSNLQSWFLDGGNDKNIFPRSADYCYNVTGYGSAIIPINQIMSYMANKMLDSVLDSWREMSAVNNDQVRAILNNAGLGSPEGFIDNVASRVRCNRGELVSKKPNGRQITGSNKQVLEEYLRELIDHYAQKVSSGVLDREYKEYLSNSFKNITNRLDMAFQEKGPYYALKLITANSVTDGCCGILEMLRQNFINSFVRIGDNIASKFRYAKGEINPNNIIGYLLSVSNNVKTGLLGMKQDDIENFLNDCQKTIEEGIIHYFLVNMDPYVSTYREFINKIVERNNTVFNVYTDVLDKVSDILNEDADRTTRGYLSDNLYSLSVFDTDKSHNTSAIIYKYIDYVLDGKFIAEFKVQFDNILKSPENRVGFIDSEKEFVAADLIRDAFDKVLKDFSQTAIERFLIAYHGDITINDINDGTFETIMNSSEQKSAKLRTAAQRICNQLRDQSKVLCNLKGIVVNQAAQQKRFLVCPEKAETLFAALQIEAPNIFGNVTICKNPNAFSIDYISSYYGISLSKLSGIDEWDNNYTDAVEHSIKALHMDESPQSDLKEFIAPLPIEEWKSHNRGHKSSVEERNYDRVNDYIRKAKGMGMLRCGYPDGAITGKRYMFDAFNRVITDEELKNVKERVFKDNDININTEPAQYTGNLIKKLGLETETALIDINVSAVGLSEADMITDEGLNIVLRKNIEVYRKLKKSIDTYEAIFNIVKEKIDSIKSADIFMQDIRRFDDWIRRGVIRLAPKGGQWIYTNGATVQGILFDEQRPMGNEDLPIYDDFVKDNAIYFAFCHFRALDEKTREGLQNKVGIMIQKEQFNDDPKLVPKIMSTLARISLDEDTLGDNISPYNITIRYLNFNTVNNEAAKYTKYFDTTMKGMSTPYDILYNFYETYKKYRKLTGK